MSFRLVPKSVTLNDLERRNGVILRCFSEFGYLPGTLRKSSRSLSHLLMSSCFKFRHHIGLGVRLLRSKHKLQTSTLTAEIVNDFTDELLVVTIDDLTMKAHHAQRRESVVSHC